MDHVNNHPKHHLVMFQRLLLPSHVPFLLQRVHSSCCNFMAEGAPNEGIIMEIYVSLLWSILVLFFNLILAPDAFAWEVLLQPLHSSKVSLIVALSASTTSSTSGSWRSLLIAPNFTATWNCWISAAPNRRPCKLFSPPLARPGPTHLFQVLIELWCHALHLLQHTQWPTCKFHVLALMRGPN